MPNVALNPVRETLWCLASVVMVMAFVLLGANQIRKNEAAGPTFTLETPDMDMVPGGAETPDPATPQQDVPATAEPFDDGVQSGQALAPPSPTEPKTGEHSPIPLNQPIVESAGTLRFGAGIVELAGIIPTPADKTCTSTGGANWPCGMVARTALRNYLRMKTVACTVPDKAWDGIVTAQCSLGGHDLARWLVDSGLVDVPAGSSFEAGRDTAQKAGLGIFGGDPRLRPLPSVPPPELEIPTMDLETTPISAQ
ncbi:thermonuclease family protein [Rhizobium sp. CFBP 8762]|uniref:thermonuclease family protein n=1 Tax=Rhizobium sp. CFBP 8762 TaxID=2775279 RepID=UPI00177F9D8F|nr:thermonuclease family protein [Rhizobium sp. CFBP 8762]MBD8553582.1 thermonuclease family protein [Rhizobium sp. CFBP 8762]